MSPETLQIAVLIAAGAVLAVVPLLIFLLASRIRNAAYESTNNALKGATRQHEQALAEFTRQYERALAETTRQHDRAVATYARLHEDYSRQHERALTELSNQQKRISQEFGMFSQKRHEVYARLYARYRHATHDLAEAISGHLPEFQKFTRDDLLRYLKRRDIREREAADAIGSMDRGDIFAMNKLMSKLHWRVTLRDANIAFERARQYEALNELYMSDAVKEAVGNVRRQVETLSTALSREQDRADQVKRFAKQDELHSSVASLLHAMRDDLRTGTDGRPKPRPELERTPVRPSLPAQVGLADKAPPAAAGAPRQSTGVTQASAASQS